jgi:hypothetical protein
MSELTRAMLSLMNLIFIKMVLTRAQSLFHRKLCKNTPLSLCSFRVMLKLTSTVLLVSISVMMLHFLIMLVTLLPMVVRIHR